MNPQLTPQPIAAPAPTLATPAAPTPTYHQQVPSHLPPVPTVTASHRPWMAIFSVLTLLVALIGSFTLYFLRVSTDSYIRANDAKITELTDELNKPPLSETSRQLAAINSALAGYKGAIAKKLDYAIFFQSLPSAMPKDIGVTSLSIDDKGAIHLAASTGSFESAGKAILALGQIKSITTPQLENIGFTAKDSGRLINFDLSATLNKAELSLTKSAATEATSIVPGLTPVPSPSTQP